ncbi:glycoside hydrolase superfamily, partial [Cladorrhinum samala]
MRSHPLFLSFLSLPLTKCPPNECCSKWDLRSTTKELCGDKTVKRPSGEIRAEHMGRAVGYYQVSVSPRTPQAFQPEDIPLGIYTHLNFAFASIDPKTYQIVPASASDAALYKRLTDLKEKDRELKAYISIGRWTAGYPIPGLSRPAFNTFSNLVASEVHQRAFFVSLIQFMNKYNFDGVDWEFPVNSDRWRNGVHFANFPTFLRNLRSALDEGAGARNGVSVMVPVAFGHLRNYDLQDITPWIDFYNVITYDSLHGLSDDGNSWISDYFDSPTRMTNIARHLDVFWRNKVPLKKLTLNLAFYPRTSTADDPGCRQPQCIFDA